MEIKSLTKKINQNLHDLDRVLNGFLSEIPFFEFRKHFLDLIEEVSKKNNLIRANIDIIGEYYSMRETLDLEYEKWDMANYESLQESVYDNINSMYVEIHNTCNTEILNFLKVYDKDNIEVIRFDEETTSSIVPHIENTERNSFGKYTRLIESINIKPGIFGFSIDIKKLFGK